MLDRTEMKFGDLGELFDGPHATPTRTQAGPYFLNITSLIDGRLDLDQSDHVSEVDFAQWTRRVTPKAGDLLFSYETRLGDAALMPPDVEACLGRRMALLRPNPALVEPAFLLYFYLSPIFQALIATHTIHGATVNRIGLSTMPEWPVAIPSLFEQRAIAEVLGSLDNKIAANTKLAETADELIRARFTDLGTDGTIKVEDLYELRREPADPTITEPATIYVGLEHIPRRSIWLDGFGTAAAVTSGKNFFTDGDVLFGKLRPYFHKIVSVAFSGICSTDVMVLRPRKDSLAGFSLAAVSSDAVVDAATAASGGTRMPRTSWKDLAAVEIPWPGEERARKFSSDIRVLEQAIKPLMDQNRTLAATRDALLPQLMSGKLRVKDAEKTLAGVL